MEDWEGVDDGGSGLGWPSAGVRGGAEDEGAVADRAADGAPEGAEVGDGAPGAPERGASVIAKALVNKTAEARGAETGRGVKRLESDGSGGGWGVAIKEGAQRLTVKSLKAKRPGWKRLGVERA